MDKMGRSRENVESKKLKVNPTIKSQTKTPLRQSSSSLRRVIIV